MKLTNNMLKYKFLFADDKTNNKTATDGSIVRCLWTGNRGLDC